MLTLPTELDRVRDDRPAYRPFRVAVRSVARLSPSFLRVTFAGDELADFGRAGLDQRVKLLLPLEGADAPRGFEHLGICSPDAVADGSWYELWRAAPEHLRNPFRTYTVRAIRQQERELDVDFAVHGDGGPASRWVRSARAGDEVVIVGPDDRSTGWRIGLDWHPGTRDELLLVGDETAVPAVCSILESLEPGVRARAFLEIPEAADALDVALGCPDHAVTWLPRNGGARGERLIAEVRDWALARRHLVAPASVGGRAAASSSTDTTSLASAESDTDPGLVWDSPAEAADTGFYAWIAGETQTVVTLRRFLVRELGADRGRVAFMGYWRQGRAELA
ncbi:siderophore-interacting protein [Gryllotalpicola protaetiae]|uniref:Siderophore-interacting protein n=1 Tax=Gryllotalpicola protaetiae TaxID=2419771 RepID=A0A387BKS7_9MICO|nr:siderophore-interacting protein [Gryllotalpicola protaetiae]AYG04473.1 siderophore-interacting protein [Gryllotalpicola protaetiae]